MSQPQIVEDRDYPIKPEDIDATRHFFEVFDHTETEISARWVVRLCQEKEHWGPFTEAELTAFYHREFPDSTFLFPVGSCPKDSCRSTPWRMRKRRVRSSPSPARGTDPSTSGSPPSSRRSRPSNVSWRSRTAWT